ncbi:MAG TPA: alpha-L-arabinofuranosidase C-terminal domain-containing protein [Opitutaceae bacterium]|nr:alpha-L-arabinofuranosidase C-terminal domain-containing protein [Opitutaceae bacterium]HRJ46847.1 alpha-L-arabinofuranosidase C-terminal domain-containing protein [Opitutaceae bacterium]
MPPSPVKLTLAPDQPGPQISRHIFGQFAEHLGTCVYDSIWVGEDSPIPNVRGIRSDVVSALREIRMPNIRWPGGCFADAYHWRNGIGPRSRRPRMRNDTWGQIETNAFGTHEFLDFCAQTGAAPVICGNLGSGTVQEMRDWVEYLNAPTGTVLADERAANGHPEPYGVRYWGVGNESWGCGGLMRAEYYADEFRRYATYLGNYEKSKLFRIATGPGLDDYHWTEVMMRECSAPRFNPGIMDGLSLHYYMNGGVPPAKVQRTLHATGFGAAEWRTVMAHAWYVDDLIARHSAIMDRYDPAKRIKLIVDEWGSWYAAEPGAKTSTLFQQQTLRDALISALTFHSFINHAERVHMANAAQVCNVLHSVLLTNGPVTIRTPNWHAFHLFAPHQDAHRLPVAGDIPQLEDDGLTYPRLSTAASRTADGVITVTLAHTDPEEPVEIALSGLPPGAKVHARILAADTLDACNTVKAPDRVAARDWTDFNFTGSTLTATLPPACIVALTFPS